MWTLSWRHKSEVTGQENKRLQDQTHLPREMQAVKNNFDLRDKKDQSISERSNVTLRFLASTTVAGAHFFNHLLTQVPTGRRVSDVLDGLSESISKNAQLFPLSTTKECTVCFLKQPKGTYNQCWKFNERPELQECPRLLIILGLGNKKHGLRLVACSCSCVNSHLASSFGNMSRLSLDRTVGRKACTSTTTSWVRH